MKSKSGDSILLHSNKKNILVDMGYSDTYTDYIKKEIINLNAKSEIIDLLIITHIDQDHISGGIDLLNDIKNSIFDKRILGRIWHNSYKNLNLVQNVDISSDDRALLNGYKNRLMQYNSEVKDGPISAKQGSTFAGGIYAVDKLESWNIDGKATPITNGIEYTIDNISITVLTPYDTALKKLERKWKKELLRMKHDFKFSDDKIFDDAYEFYLLNESNEQTGLNSISQIMTGSVFETLISENKLISTKKDSSITNSSSITMIIEDGHKRVLLTGDATNEDLSNALIDYKKNGGNTEFDLVKLSHHGSVKNNSTWLNEIKSKYYVVSTDSSKHEHPNIETFVNVLLSNPEDKTLCFNHDIEIIDVLNNKKLMSEYNYKILKPNQGWGIEIEL